MKHTAKCLCVLCLCLSLLFSLAIASFADVASVPNQSAASATLLVHLESGKILTQKNASGILPAGSSVKLLSGLIFCEELEEEQNSNIVITSNMLSGVSGHNMNLKDGDQYSIRSLLYFSVCGGYNDAYYVLANFISGSISNFAILMNNRAKELGLQHSEFTNPVGMDDVSTTTAEDLFILAKKAYENDLFMVLSSTTQTVIGTKTVKNRNELVFANTTTEYYNSYCHGMSAGNTGKAGTCIITEATGKDNCHYIAILLGGKTDEFTDYGYQLAGRLVNWAVKNFSYQKVIEPDADVCTIPVTVSDVTSEVTVTAKETLYCFLPNEAKIGTDVTFSLRLQYEELEAPVEAGKFVGYLAVIYDNEVVGTIELYTKDAVERSSLIGSLKQIKSLTEHRGVRACLIFFSISFIGWLAFVFLIPKWRHKKWNRYFGKGIPDDKKEPRI